MRRPTLKHTYRLLLLSGVGLLLSACMGFGPAGQSFTGGNYRSNGERIYYSGTSANNPISYSGGSFGGMMGGSMMRGKLACADCHGNDARGGGHFMGMSVMDAPDIRWSTLAAEDHGEPGDHEEGAMDHPPYDEASFKQAVTQGLDPGGEPLDNAMLRWRMSDQDISDLIAFLEEMQ